MSHLGFPDESAEYRKARNALLAEEIALRTHIEAVAAQRRALPPGGEVPEDYVFERIGENGMPEKVEMSKLFGRRRALIPYSFMMHMQSHGYVEAPDGAYMLTWIDRGADVLVQNGLIGKETAEALKAEAQGRSTEKRWFGHIAFASVLARKPA